MLRVVERHLSRTGVGSPLRASICGGVLVRQQFPPVCQEVHVAFSVNVYEISLRPNPVVATVVTAYLKPLDTSTTENFDHDDVPWIGNLSFCSLAVGEPIAVFSDELSSPYNLTMI